MVGALAPRRENDMNLNLRRRAVTVAVAAGIAVSAVTPSISAPVLSNTAALKSSASAGDIVNVRWRGRGIGYGIAAGVAAGALAGAAASSYYGDPYYGGPTYYAAPDYGAAYSYDQGNPGYYGYGRRAPQYDSSGAAVNPSPFCPPGAAAQNRC
jgi:hypothetical protein